MHPAQKLFIVPIFLTPRLKNEVTYPYQKTHAEKHGLFYLSWKTNKMCYKIILKRQTEDCIRNKQCYKTERKEKNQNRFNKSFNSGF